MHFTCKKVDFPLDPVSWKPSRKVHARMAPTVLVRGGFPYTSPKDARKEYLWKESGEEARWKQSLWDSIHVTDSSGEIANERACGFLNAGCEAKCQCSARMLGEKSVDSMQGLERTHLLRCCDISIYQTGQPTTPSLTIVDANH